MNTPIKIDKSSNVSDDITEAKMAELKKNRRLKLLRLKESTLVDKDNTDIATAMAATLCHEINNPLMTITAITEVLLNKSKDLSPDIIEKIDGIAKAAERIKKATHKLIGLDSLQYCETAASRLILTKDSDKKSDK